MKITVFGAGYVGLVTGTCLAELGNDVTLVDIDEKRVKDLNKGVIPIYEPGLSEMIMRNVKENRISFTLDPKSAVKSAKIIFIAVGTPPNEDGSTNLSYVLSVAKTIGQNLDDYKVVVDKSTVPVGTADKVTEEIKNNMNGNVKFDVVSNPEFLKEGSAVRDFMAPDRVVVGSESVRATELMRELYQGVVRVERPLFVTDVKSAEIIKYASNAMLACRISFMNQLSHLCEAEKADIKDVATGMGMDKRIGPRFLQAGIGYGGSCFPKDVKSLAITLKEHGLNSSLMETIDSVNEFQKTSLFPKIEKKLGNFKGKNIGIWGLAFKPKTDDIREAPAIIMIEKFLEAGASITVFDPEAQDNTKEVFGDKIVYAKEPYDCAKDADCLILVTEWDEFRSPDWSKIKGTMKGKLIVDGRNIYNPKVIDEQGFDYLGVGR